MLSNLKIIPSVVFLPPRPSGYVSKLFMENPFSVLHTWIAIAESLSNNTARPVFNRIFNLTRRKVLPNSLTFRPLSEESGLRIKNVRKPIFVFAENAFSQSP